MRRALNGKETFGNYMLAKWRTLASRCSLNTALNLLKRETFGGQIRVTKRNLNRCINQLLVSNSGSERQPSPQRSASPSSYPSLRRRRRS